jgi:hypothetical protein
MFLFFNGVTITCLVIRRHYRPIAIQWLSYLSPVTSILRMRTLGGILKGWVMEGCRDGAEGASFSQVGEALGIHHTVITKALERCRLHGTPARGHAESLQRVTTPAQDRFLNVQARRARFSSKWPFLCCRGPRPRIRYIEGCMKFFPVEKTLHTYLLDASPGPFWNAP